MNPRSLCLYTCADLIDMNVYLTAGENVMPVTVTATSVIRKMRGGAQSYLLGADDGRFYVVKFRENPQGSRVLVNEWVGTRLIQYLDIACPRPAIVALTSAFIEAHPEVSLAYGGRNIQPSTGKHFGSQYPVDPRKVAVYDFIPDALLPSVWNIRDYARILALDLWVGNTDMRQSIFFRARVRDCIPTADAKPGRKAFITLMIDNGQFFCGPLWQVWDQCDCRCLSDQVYITAPSVVVAEAILRVTTIPRHVVAGAFCEAPGEWVDDVHQANQLIDRLMNRRRQVRELTYTVLERIRRGGAPSYSRTPAVRSSGHIQGERTDAARVL